MDKETAFSQKWLGAARMSFLTNHELLRFKAGKSQLFHPITWAIFRALSFQAVTLSTELVSCLKNGMYLFSLHLLQIIYSLVSFNLTVPLWSVFSEMVWVLILSAHLNFPNNYLPMWSLRAETNSMARNHHLGLVNLPKQWEILRQPQN